MEFFHAGEKGLDFQRLFHAPPVEKPVENVEKSIGRLFEGRLLTAFMSTGGQGPRLIRTTPGENRYPMSFARFVFAVLFRHECRGDPCGRPFSALGNAPCGRMWASAPTDSNVHFRGLAP